MKILVCAKRVVDANVKVRVKADATNVDIEHSKMSLNPFDENAIEEAVRLKEAGIATEIIAVSVGEAKCVDTLRMALARGCDRAIWVNSAGESSDNSDARYTNDDIANESYQLEPINIAKILSAIVKQEQPQLIMLGKQAIDDDANQVGQMLAGMLNYPQATFVSQLTVIDSTTLEVRREIDNGSQRLRLNLPAVVTADLYLNEPRFIKLPQLMLAKKKPVTEVKLNALGLDIRQSTRLLRVSDATGKKKCQYVEEVSELAAILHKHMQQIEWAL